MLESFCYYAAPLHQIAFGSLSVAAADPRYGMLEVAVRLLRRLVVPVVPEEGGWRPPRESSAVYRNGSPPDLEELGAGVDPYSQEQNLGMQPLHHFDGDYDDDEVEVDPHLLRDYHGGDGSETA